MNKRIAMQKALTLLLLFCLCFGSNSCSLLEDLAPSHEDDGNSSAWIAVPVFYATNRQRAEGKLIDFTEKKNSDILLYGVKNVIVPRPDNVSIMPELMKRMGWLPVNLVKSAPCASEPELPAGDKTLVADQEFSPMQMISNFDKYRAGTGSQESAIFVHGCCATFKTSMKRAAKLSLQLQIPVVVYDWDAPIGFTHYLKNETLAQQTYDGFCNFLDSLAKYLPTDKTIIIGHSLGAAFVDEAFARRYERYRHDKKMPKYAEIILSQPDIDARAYINHAKNIIEQTNKTTLFLVLNDPRLRVSAMAHGGYERLGRPGPLLDKLSSLANQRIIDMSASGIGHTLPVDFIGSIFHTGTIDDRNYKLLEKSPHLFVVEKKHIAQPEQ